MPGKECPRCGGSIRPYLSPGERQPDYLCAMCGREPPPAPPAPSSRTQNSVAARQRKLAPRRAAIRKLREQGLSGLEIGRRLGLSPAQAQRDIRKMGLSTRYQWISNETIEHIHTLALDGVSCHQIAATLGISVHTATAHVATLDRPTGQAVGRRKVLRLLATGRALDPPMTYQSIADRAGVSNATVWRLAEKHGLHAGAPTTLQAATARHSPPQPAPGPSTASATHNLIRWTGTQASWGTLRRRYARA